MSLMSDAISHTVLLGIVIGFFIVEDIHSPFLIFTAALSGVLTVSLVELLLRTGRFKADAAIGLVFPVLFSIGVIMVSTQARNVHIDVDAVLLGELAFAPFNRAEFLGLDLPRGIWVMGAILLINIVVIAAFYKELKLATFDTGLATVLGFSPALIHYGLMSLVSVTAVGAFDHVGAVLVVALMIAPPAAAYLLTNSLSRMLILSVVIGVASALSGYWIARLIGDVSIAGAMATMTGVFFMASLIFAPERGLVAKRIQHVRRKRRFAVETLLVHLNTHTDTPGEVKENSLTHLIEELNWQPNFARDTVRRASQQGLVEIDQDRLRLTAQGRQAVRQN
jgi:manganese/zinc/iron transport system permease protein